MASQQITIPIDPESARAYEAATEEEKKTLQTLLSLWLKELVVAEPAALRTIMDEVSAKARAKGLRPEDLETLLRGA